MSNGLKIFDWICRIVVALILFQTLFFKFTGAEESKYIFSKVLSPEMEAVGRIGSGLVELVAVMGIDVADIPQPVVRKAELRLQHG